MLLNTFWQTVQKDDPSAISAKPPPCIPSSSKSGISSEPFNRGSGLLSLKKLEGEDKNKIYNLFVHK